MAASVTGILSEQLRQNILESKVLVVGAGGIGCELLKNLVLTGFQDIEIIDLDTIDVSNLNRQFLFHKEHVGKPKAVIARETALTFNPDVNIKAYHDSITKTDYGVSFFKQFKVVLNALDNRAARNHVNRMCLAASIPLIESGTAGYSGQVELIMKGLTQCYECEPKPAQKTFPGCTIRNTPSELIHCIVWAKHLFNQLFGEEDADNEVSPDQEDPEAALEENTEGGEPVTVNFGNIVRISTRQWAKDCGYDYKILFKKLFIDDIKYLLTMENLWKERKPPVPCKDNWEEAISETEHFESKLASNVLQDQVLYTLPKWKLMFRDSCNTLSQELKNKPPGDHLVWDKDDRAAMDFVTACANLRATIFDIKTKSRFDIKAMAGNIIPAIATTNAIIAGIVVLYAFKVLEKSYKECCTVYLRQKPNHRGLRFVPEKNLIPPKKQCYVCSPKPQILLRTDINKLTVNELKEDILIKTLNMVAPDTYVSSSNNVIISSDEDETEGNMPKVLSEFGIVEGTILKCDDFLQNYELDVIIMHRDHAINEPKFEVLGNPTTFKNQEQQTTPPNGEDLNAPGPSKRRYEDDDNDDLIIICNADDLDTSPKKKMKCDPNHPAKKVKSSHKRASGDDCIKID